MAQETKGLLERTVNLRRSRTCSKCKRTFGRLADKTRHEQFAKCQTDEKSKCPVCKKKLTGRGDAMRRHQLRTGKCVDIQKTMSRDDLDGLGCVTDADRAKDEARLAKLNGLKVHVAPEDETSE